MNRLYLNIKTRKLIISDRKKHNRDASDLEDWLQRVEACRKDMIKAMKEICKMIDAFN